MADNLYVPQVDYTSRDFLSISDDMKSLIPNFAPQWVSRDLTDPGIVLVELFAYMGDMLNYYIDRAANESFIDTSTQRDTVLNLAKLLNYTPNDISPATGSVTLTNQSSSGITVPALSLFSSIPDGTGNQITFELTSDVFIAGSSGTTYATATGTVIQGITARSEAVGTSDGTAYQQFKLSNPGVITANTITVTVGTTTYQKVTHVIDYTANDPVFSVYTDGTGYTYIQFGDGNSGLIPPAGSKIYVTYRYTSTAGSLGNVLASTVTVVVSDKYGQPIPNVTVNNPIAFSGGADAESTDSVRINAPLALRSLNRAVSIKDYAQLAVQVTGVAKAIASSTVYTQVIIYIAANGGNPASSSLLTSVYNYLSDKIPPNTSIIVKDFTAAYPYLNLTVNVLPQYDPTVVKTAVTNALYDLFSFNNVVFNDLISIGDINTAARSIDGVAYVTINDYEKLPLVYSQSAVSSTVATTSTTTTTSVTVTDSSGLWVGAAVFSIVSSTGTSLYSYQTPVTTVVSIPDSTHVVLSTTPTAITISASSVITVQGAAGNTTDLSCNVDEVPILAPSYITVSTTGGIS
jgi:hypothetical protein